MKKLISIFSVLLMMLSHLAAAQDIKVSGSVTDANGPVAGAFVVVKGTTNGTVSDLDGNYSITAPSGAVLEFSCMGYVSQEVPVAGQSVINVVLKEDNEILADAVVLGYGVATKKKDLSAAVGVVSNPDALSARPVSSVEGMLQGQIAGVSISSDGGDPTSAPNVVIRGQGSQNSEQVLWVVDGIPGAPIASLNDIESIVVLKDAASAAIYGAQSGAGGVILVTTKKGGKEGLSVNYDGVYGVRQATKLIQSLNAEEAIQMRKLSYANAGLSLPDAWNPEKNSWIKTTRTNWMDEVFRTAFYNRNSVSVNYNSDKLQNRLTFSNDANDGVLVGTYNKKTGIHYTGVFTINKWVKLTEDLTWTQVNQRSVNTSSPENGVLINAIFMPQSAEAYAKDGSFGGIVPAEQAQWASAHGDSINPLRLCLADTNYNKSNSLWTTTGLEIGNIVPGLKFNSRFTYAVESGFSKIFTPRRLELGKPVDNNFLDYASNREERWKTENTLTYDKTFKKHSVGALLSTTADHFYGRYLNVQGQNFGDESVYLQYLANAGSVKGEDSFSGNDANLAIVARASYSYDDRYFVTASWRRDYA
ncbi:MAG: SusC/RagA family TonB-linked outer membrane protein, partial [Bacteroidales bacterium]|nr:SusC/RagA family TonB-linked outer membrane protein [Candidatus Cryptobacteroides equifaecalis]